MIALNMTAAELRTLRKFAHLFGSRRTNAQKRADVKRLLMAHPDWSSYRIAAACQVSDVLVGKLRRQSGATRTREYINRYGQLAVMQIYRIGKPKQIKGAMKRHVSH